MKTEIDGVAKLTWANVYFVSDDGRKIEMSDDGHIATWLPSGMPKCYVHMKTEDDFNLLYDAVNKIWEDKK